VSNASNAPDQENDNIQSATTWVINMIRLPTLIFSVWLLSIITGCASVKTEGVGGLPDSGSRQKELSSYQEFTGNALRVQVMQFKISPELTAQYPEFAEKQVGLGLSGRIVDELYESKRFVFVEEKSEMQKKILEQWALSLSGIVAENQQISTEGLSAPQYLVYAELTDFSVSQSEKISGIMMEKQATTRMSLQIRLLDIATGEYIPSSGTGEATTSASSVWVNPDMPFDQSTVGIATQRAARTAVIQLIQRMKW